jgi:FAD/FMN-containing dehydrogenase
MPSVSDVLRDLGAALGADRIRTPPDIPHRNWADVSGLKPVCPEALILPRSVEEVCAVLAICHRHRQPVIVQGGMTGAAAGAHPQAGEIALSLERLSGIEEVDVHSATVTALAGTPLALVQRAAEEAGLSCGIDLGARDSATIGGIVSTNAGGNQVVRYGMARRNVLGLEVVLADGTRVTGLNKMMKNNSGYDWTQIFIGSEGTLGVVTRVVLALHPRLNAVHCALVSVDGTDKALALLRLARRMLPAGLLVFELMWREYYDLATSVVALPPPLPPGQDGYVLVEAPGADGADHPIEAWLVKAYEEGLIGDAVIAKSHAERDAFWAFREAAYRFSAEIWPPINYDISFPLDRMAEAIEWLRRDVPALGDDIVWAVFGHLADGNVHVMVMTPRKSELKPAADRAVYAITAALGGSVSAEHGIGRVKKRQLPLSRSAPELALMASLKRCLDPHALLNRGRVIEPAVDAGPAFAETV